MSIADLKVRISGNADQFDSAMKKMQKRFDKSVRKLERTGKSLTQKVTVPIGLMAVAAGKAAIDFESAFAGVRKTVDATEGEFDMLRKGILDMSKEMPTSANEIAGVAEAAGQLGIQTDKILEFSKTMVMLGDTTNLTADQAATSLARISNVMQLPQDQFDEMGSTIVDLGNNFATTEAEIVDFANRIAGAGKIAGLSADQVFAIGTAMSSVGIRAESGGTAVQKALLAINDAVARGGDELRTFAETAGMSAESFQALWRDDAGQAFTAFVNGLGNSGDNATQILDDVGLSSERTRAAFLSLAGSGDLLNRTMDTGASAWEENIALSNEAQQRYDTVASKIATLINRVKALGISIGEALMPTIESTIESMEDLTKWFEDLGEEGQKTALVIAGIAAASGPLALLVVRIVKITKAIKAMNLAWLASPWGAVTAGVVGIIALASTANRKVRELTETFTDTLAKGAKQSWQDVNKTIAEVASRIERMEEIKGIVGGPGVNEKRLKELRESLTALIALRDSLAQQQVQEIIDKKEADRAKKVADQIERVKKAMASLQEIQSRPSIGRAGITGFTKPEVDLSGMKASMKRQGKELSEVTKVALAGSVEAFDDAQMNIEQRAESFSNVMEQVMASAITSFAKSIGKLAAGAGSMKDVAFGLINVLADMAIQIGSLFVSLGTATAAAMNPATLIASLGTSAIVAGGALIAAGAALKAIFADAGSRDIGGPAMKDQPYLIGKGPHQELFVPDRSGSVIPNNKLRGMGGSGVSEGALTRAFSRALQGASLKARGQDLVLVLENAGHTLR